MSPPRSDNTDPVTGHITALSVVPKPYQSPHPPLWQVIDSAPSIEFAARNGLQGMFWIPPTDAMVDRFELYSETASEARGHDVPMGEGVTLVRDMFITETMAEAEDLAGEAFLRYMEWVCHFRGLSNHRYPGEELPETPGKLDLLSYQWLHPRNMLFGTADYVAEQIQEMKEKLNLQSLLVWSNFPGMDQRAVMDSVQRFTEDVMPQFAEENNS
jgi:alkanesulfonate monooxygenase SsuD/methylene tetrahydromethanopterin reductase-like flavin-dependent oxidoreductase (luciferase family)